VCSRIIVYDLFYNRMFLDPLVHGVWPPALLALLEQHQVTWEASAEELALASHVT
jgi:6-phospho-beta-glucosidase